MFGARVGANYLLSLEITPDGTIWSVSRRLLQLLGHSSGSMHVLLGLNLLSRDSFIETDDRPRFAAAFHSLLDRLASEVN